ncbi:translation elongation factor Ts [Halochromatium glycolicum]|jgi:elongation factor Ts|uniref:Elongation factor Ts n=1 Tax=Halochromatium glycolicum TaxID=85075 RepID=A0AAJ0U2G7_9GAMM|nr:translation elongation factor Ts [Halochromatium glycolicum]MBK1703858.1 translation elongation factor Ts [Halochromatium glycolicum]
MAISAALVKELRERTGAGMMECKKALLETDGDIDAAIEAMRKSGQAKAAKKAGRVAADGVVELRVADDGNAALMVEVNSETDFVAKDENFAGFAAAVADTALERAIDEEGALAAQPLAGGAGETVEEARQALIAKIGENVAVRRVHRLDAPEGRFHTYRHGVRIGVLVELVGGDETLGRDIAMHIAASNPLCIAAEDVPADALEQEREIFKAQALESGKPANIIDKITEGRMRKYLEEVTLLGQAFVKDPDTRVGDLLKSQGAEVKRFIRMEVGEGIEKKVENFADEVKAQAGQVET